MSGTYHVSFIYHDMRGLEQFTEHTVKAGDEDEATEIAEHRPTAPNEYDEVEVRKQDTDTQQEDSSQ